MIYADQSTRIKHLTFYRLPTFLFNYSSANHKFNH